MATTMFMYFIKSNTFLGITILYFILITHTAYTDNLLILIINISRDDLDFRNIGNMNKCVVGADEILAIE